MHGKELILYHGTPDEVAEPTLGLGNDRRDYGRGFYTTDDSELAKEWAVCRPEDAMGWVHAFKFDAGGIRILDFEGLGTLAWLAELMKHREASDTKRYRLLAERFIQRYGVDTSGYDVIRGWRANASYFYIAKEFVRDNVDICILDELLSLGALGIQYCLKSKRAYSRLTELQERLEPVSYAEYNPRYNERDSKARQRMRELINSDANPVTNVFSELV